MNHDEFKKKEKEILADYEAGILTRFGVAQWLMRVGANSKYATDIANSLNKKSPLTATQKKFFSEVSEQLNDFWEKSEDSIHWGGPTIHPDNPINPAKARILSEMIGHLL